MSLCFPILTWTKRAQQKLAQTYIAFKSKADIRSPFTDQFCEYSPKSEKVDTVARCRLMVFGAETIIYILCPIHDIVHFMK